MTNKELNPKSIGRPFGVLTFIIISLAVTIVTCYLLVIGKETLSAAMPIFMAVLAAWSPIVGFYFHNRSKEKLAGKENDPISDE